MRKDTRFHRPDRSELEARLPAGTLSTAQSIGVWNMMLQADDPGEVARWYRSYRDSPHCALPREQLRSMRDTLITGMREANKKDDRPRKELKKGVHYPDYEKQWVLPNREGA